VRDALSTLLLLPVLLAGVAAAALLSPDRHSHVRCASGELAQNPLDPSGREQPRHQDFDNVRDAETFLCLDLPELGPAAGWRVHNVNVIRSHGLHSGQTAQQRYASLEYVNEALATFIGLVPYQPGVIDFLGLEPPCDPPGPPSVDFTRSDVTIRGQQTTLYLTANPNVQQRYAVCFRLGEMLIFAGGSYRVGVDLATEVLPLLETMR
jgi:hypothetical protein